MFASLAGRSVIVTGKVGQLGLVRSAALFFATKEAGFITVQTLIVDGGQVLPESLAAAE